VKLMDHFQFRVNAYLLPLPHPYFALSNSHGAFRIENLPLGTWEFTVWHERKGYVKTHAWPKGRFTLDINSGENGLGTIKLAPSIFNDPLAEKSGTGN
jgi:hypothetical protein